jgi:hypothetical protein
LYFTSNHQLAESVRGYFREGALLAVTYTDRGSTSNTLTDARSPSSVASRLNIDGGTTTTTTSTGGQTVAPTPTGGTSVYGRGYNLAFRIPEKNAHFDKSGTHITSAFPAMALSSVTETSMLKGYVVPDIGTWTCPDSMRFRIVLADDTSTVGCETKPDDYGSFPDLRIVRNTLKVEDWYVDMARKCIVPKKPQNGASCYGNQRYVEYDLTKTCHLGLTNNGPTLRSCVGFASVCYRTN